MSRSMSRRSLLGALGCTAAVGAVGTRLLPAARAGEPSESSICLSMLYRNGPQASFDAARYAAQYLPLLKQVCGDSVERVELRIPRPQAVPGAAKPRPSGSHTPQPAAQTAAPAIPLLASVSIWINDARAFGERTAAATRLAEEFRQVTEVEPLLQFDQVLSLLGDARDSVPPAGEVASTYFPATVGAKFDAKYYGEKVIPMMIRLHGARAIRRVEFNLGVVQSGQAPAITAASHFYIRDRAAWDAAAMQAYPQLMAEGPRYTTIRPLMADMQVAAAG